MAAPRAFVVRSEEEPTTADLTDDEVLLKLMKARIAIATGFFEVLEFCQLNGGDKAEIEFLAERGKEHWDGARELIRQRRALDGSRRQPLRVAEAAAGK